MTPKEQVFADISSELCINGVSSIKGFGKFVVVDRAERMARNPRSGEAILVKAKRTIKFVPSKSLKELFNDER